MSTRSRQSFRVSSRLVFVVTLVSGRLFYDAGSLGRSTRSFPSLAWGFGILVRPLPDPPPTTRVVWVLSLRGYPVTTRGGPTFRRVPCESTLVPTLLDTSPAVRSVPQGFLRTLDLL